MSIHDCACASLLSMRVPSTSRSAVVFFAMPAVQQTELTDVAIPSTGVNGNVWTAPRFDSLYVGWITYESQQTVFDVWYDDIAIDVKKIGCH